MKKKFNFESKIIQLKKIEHMFVKSEIYFVELSKIFVSKSKIFI